MTSTRERLTDFLRAQVGGSLLVVLVVGGVVALTTDRFLLADNLRNVGLQVAIVAIVAADPRPRPVVGRPRRAYDGDRR